MSGIELALAFLFAFFPHKKSGESVDFIACLSCRRGRDVLVNKLRTWSRTFAASDLEINKPFSRTFHRSKHRFVDNCMTRSLISFFNRKTKELRVKNKDKKRGKTATWQPVKTRGSWIEFEPPAVNQAIVDAQVSAPQQWGRAIFGERPHNRMFTMVKFTIVNFHALCSSEGKISAPKGL